MAPWQVQRPPSIQQLWTTRLWPDQAVTDRLTLIGRSVSVLLRLHAWQSH